MKNVFNWLLAAVCLFMVGNVQVMASNEEKKKEEVKTVPIPISTGEVVHGNDVRGGSCIPFTAYYQEGVIYINTSAELSVISLNVGNEVSGQVWSSVTDVSDGMGEISIFDGGAGSYTVEIVTEYGECFTGSFRLQ